MIALDPNQTFEFTLQIEEGKPTADRAVLVSRFMTARQLAHVDALTDQAAAAAASGEDPKPHLVAAVLVALAAVRLPANVVEKETAAFSLDIDAGKPDGERPVFSTVLMGPADIGRSHDLLASADAGVPAQRLEIYEQAIAIAGIKPPGGLDDVAGSLTLSEMHEVIERAVRLSRVRLLTIETLPELDEEDLWEIVLKQIRLSRLTEVERKKSALQSASAAARKSVRSALPAA
jgi:hypothetical protein